MLYTWREVGGWFRYISIVMTLNGYDLRSVNHSEETIGESLIDKLNGTNSNNPNLHSNANFASDNKASDPAGYEKGGLVRFLISKARHDSLVTVDEFRC
jgi:hypothetical protein